ncbi:MAG: hypothetical protein WA004_13585 [Saprospiraceae bacterium]
MKTRNIITALAICWLPIQVFSQSPCDLVYIDDIRYDAFNDSFLVVQVTNNSGDIFSYPGFILYHPNGDTLAVETVNFFGIGGTHAAALRIVSNTANEIGDGVLELWTGFYDSLACIFPVSESFCPDTGCHEFIFSLGNFGGAFTQGDFSYSITGQNGNVLASESFFFNDTIQQFSDTVCLLNGSYTLGLATGNAAGGQLYYSLQELDSTIWGAYLSEFFPFGSPPLSRPFSVYKKCETATGMKDPVLPAATADIIWNTEGIRASSKESQILEMAVFDPAGRRVSSRRGPANELFIPSGYLHGLYFVSISFENGARLCEKVFFP